MDKFMNTLNKLRAINKSKDKQKLFDSLEEEYKKLESQHDDLVELFWECYHKLQDHSVEVIMNERH